MSYHQNPNAYGWPYRPCYQPCCYADPVPAAHYPAPPTYGYAPQPYAPHGYTQRGYGSQGARPQTRTGVAGAPRFSSAHHSSDPTSYGWAFQGCNPQARVEFYVHESTGVKLDYWPTTGTVKTSMDHPSQGKTQMFRRGLSEAQFQAVLLNPRAHTGRGYQTKRFAPY